MNEALKKIWKSKYSNLVIGLTFMTFFGVFLYFDRPNVASVDELIEITGTLDHIEELVYSKNIKKTERDSTYHIFLKEYPCKFQVSYMRYNRKDFLKSSSIGDKINLHIASEDFNQLSISDRRIRSFSLTVNDNTYLSKDNGLRGFGKGYFEMGLIIIPLFINLFVIHGILKK